MKNQDELVTQTDAQRDPGRCKAEDWTVIRDDDEAFHGQSSDEIQRASDAECGRKKFAGTPDLNSVDDAGKPRTP